jgi:putative tricarboxylic transport membrane protein
LESGLGLVPVTIGLLGLGEFLYQLYGKKDEVQGLAGSERRSGQGKGTSLQVGGSLRTLRPFFVVAMFGAVVAFLVGVIPGLGATAATFIVYQQLRLVAKRPAELGHGSDEGLVAQNAADNAVIGGELVPTLGLGIPGSGSMAVLMGALVVQGIQPGPNVLRSRPELVGTVAAGLLLAGVALLPLGWAFSYSAMRIARLWQPAIFGTGVILILLGAYSVSNRIFEVYVIIAFGVLGFILRRHEFPVAATVIAFVLSGLLETSFRRGILMELGSISGFLMRPITASILVFGVFMLVQQTGLLRRIRPGARSLDE